MNKKNLILNIQEYCKYYETKFVYHLDLVDMICVEMFNKHAFSMDKYGKINSYCISQKESDCNSKNKNSPEFQESFIFCKI